MDIVEWGGGMKRVQNAVRLAIYHRNISTRICLYGFVNFIPHCILWGKTFPHKHSILFHFSAFNAFLFISIHSFLESDIIIFKNCTWMWKFTFFPCTKWCQASKIFMVHKVIDYKWNKCRCKFNKGIYSHSLVSDKTFLLLLLTAIACLHSMDLSFNAITMNCSQDEENTIDGDLDSDWKQKENQMSWRRLFCNRLRTKGRMNIILC